MTEPPNTEALLARVRQTVESAMNGEYGRRNALAALDAIASELERRKLSICAYCGVAFEWNGEGDSCPGCNRALAAEAELERVRAERDADMSALHDVREAAGVRLVQARLDRAVEALRTICDIGETRDVEVARAALAEIEESG